MRKTEDSEEKIASRDFTECWDEGDEWGRKRDNDGCVRRRRRGRRRRRRIGRREGRIMCVWRVKVIRGRVRR